jgi:hypothetical protein
MKQPLSWEKRRRKGRRKSRKIKNKIKTSSAICERKEIEVERCGGKKVLAEKRNYC